MNKNPVVHFEMPYDDAHRLSQFYQKVFGWQMQTTGEDMGHYVVAYTTETDDHHMVTVPGTINGGFYPKAASDAKYPSVVISVDDIEQSMKKIKASGGKLLGKPADIPGVGKFVSFVDTEGNRVSILQAGK